MVGNEDVAHSTWTDEVRLPSIPRRPLDRAQEAALPPVAQRERVVHPGAGFLVARGHLGGEQRSQAARLGDLLPEHDLAPCACTERGAEAREDREQRPAALGVA